MSGILDHNGQPWVSPTPQSRQTALHNSFTNSTRSRSRGGSRGPTGSANAHRDSISIQKLIPECQQAGRNDLIAQMVMAARADAIVGDEPIFEALSDDDDWNTEVEDRFDDWCDEEADLSKTKTFAGICSGVVNRWDDSGGTLVNKVVHGSGRSMRCRLETIEIMRLMNPGRKQDSKTMVGGVEISEKTGAAINYYIGDWNDQGTIVKPTSDATDASNLWLLNNPRRLETGQHRCEPMLGSVLDRLETIDQSTEATWDAYQLAAMIALFIKRNNPGGPTTQQQAETAMVTGGQARNTTEARERGVWNRGMVMEGEVGEEVQTISPAHPVSGFDVMFWTEFQIICGAMDTTPELVAMRFIKNYAASRSAISVAWERVEFYQKTLTKRFMIPVYRWWVSNEILSGRIKEVSGWKKCAWHLPVMPVLDVKVETEAELMKLSGGVGLHSTTLRRLGSGKRAPFMKKWIKQTQENIDAGLTYGQPVQVTRSEQVEPYALEENGTNADA